MYTFALINTKGGVGKSALAYLFARRFGHLQYRTVAIDCDSQMTLTCRLDTAESNREDVEASLGNLLVYRSGDVHPTKQPVTDPLDLVVSTPDGLIDVIRCDGMLDYECKLAEAAPRGSKKMLKEEVVDKIGDNYDIAVIDCAGKSGWMTDNVRNAADFFIVPVLAEDDSIAVAKNTVDALSQLCKLDGVDPADRIAVLLNQYNPQIAKQRQKRQKLEEVFGPLLLEEKINLRGGPMSKSNDERIDIWDLAEKSKSSKNATKDFRKEVDAVVLSLIDRLGLR